MLTAAFVHVVIVVIPKPPPYSKVKPASYLDFQDNRHSLPL